MLNHDTPCAALALCRSESPPGEDAGFGWVFPEPSLECVEEALANARMFCDDQREQERSVSASLKAYWSGPDGDISFTAPLTPEGLERLLEEPGRAPPRLIAIHILTREPARARPEALERLRRGQRNDLMIGLAAIHAWGFEFEEIRYATSAAEPSEASAKRAAEVALERMSLDQTALEPKASAPRPGL